MIQCCRRYPLRAGVCLLTTALLIAGCGKSEKAEEPEVSVQAVAAKTEDISKTVTADAVVFPLAQAIITPKVNAPVKKFFVTRGQKVRQGQLLAELESRDLSAAALDNKGAFEQAEASYNNSVNAALPEEVQKSELEVQTSKQELDAAQKLYSSRQDLFKQGALPRKDLDAAAVQLAQAKTAYDTAKKHLESLNAVGKQATIKSAGGQLTSARGKLLASEAQLSYTDIHSPIDGVVTDRPLYPGEMASTSAPLLTVMNTTQVIAKAHVAQSDAMLLRKGDRATLAAMGLEKPLVGTVTVVSPALDPNSTTVEIWVQAPNPDQQLRPGMAVQLSITAQTVHSALVVPSSALLNASGDGAQVMVIDAQNTAQSRDVKLGVQTPQEAQVVSGLKPGEQVITEGAYGLPDKTKVTVEKPATAAEGKEKASPQSKSKDDDKD
ncbi:MAG TPA: efflux RND transporter periplasmic adaptor subunit [Candidatus Angelobacter sp.]|nr:efflux RND transporter periplasmic adaptor subunit [Candidatus Angelobacter sp.]